MGGIAAQTVTLSNDLIKSSLTAFLGDSITKGNGNSGANTILFGGRSYPTIACEMAGGALRPYIIAGVIGERSDQILARLSSDIINLRTPKPGLLVTLAGTNDMSQLGGTDIFGRTITMDTFIGNLGTIYDQARGAGIEPIGMTLPPNQTNRTAIAIANPRIKAICDRRGMLCIDIHRALVNPATGGYVAGYDDDGTHPGPVGQRKIGGAVAAAMNAYPRAVPVNLTQDNADAVNMIDGGCFLTDTNADGVADFWVNNAATGTCTPTIESGDTNIIGNWQVMTTTVAGQKLISQTIPPGTASPRGWAVGDVLEFSCLISATVEAGLFDPAITFIVGGAGVSFAPVYQQQADVTRGYIFMRFTMPVGSTSLQARITSSIASSGTGVIKVAQTELLNLTRLGIA